MFPSRYVFLSPNLEIAATVPGVSFRQLFEAEMGIFVTFAK